jgi:hypothetical protein
MFKQLSYCTATFLAFGAVCSAQGPQNEQGRALPPAWMAWVVEGPTAPESRQVAVAADRQGSHDWRKFEWTLEPAAPMEETNQLRWGMPGAPGHDLPKQIVSWLAENSESPPVYNRPEIYVSAPVRLTALDAGDLSEASLGLFGEPRIGRYEDSTRRVYFSNGWNPETVGGQSLLVHQMVYHLQNLAGLKYECPQARARLAYDAQARWLSQTGRTLESEFGIDAGTLLLSTDCYVP